MEQESERIEKHIEDTRENLGRSLNELESRVRSTFDWRQQFDKNPWLVLGVAFTGGAAVSALLSGSGDSHPSYRSEYSAASPSQPSRFAGTWHAVQAALMAAAAKKAERFLDEVIPGFGEEYRTQKGKRLNSEVQ